MRGRRARKGCGTVWDSSGLEKLVLPKDRDRTNRHKEPDREKHDEALAQDGLIEKQQFHIHHRAEGEEGEFRAP